MDTPLGPDLRGCPEHGMADMAKTWSKRDRQFRFYCNACRRQRESASHYGGPRCHKRGHLKTPWTWRCYSGVWRCLPCAAIKSREGRLRRRAASQAEQAPEAAA